MKLVPANHNDMSAALVAARHTHHLSKGWIPSQSWYLRDDENLPLGEAQVVVTGGGAAGCVAIIHLYTLPMEVIICRGLVEALVRIGYDRDRLKVA
jgi:hypothetical protein